jgi:glycosyltransferase involved in cell wall biosynthesis
MREAYECCDIVVNASPLMGNVARTLLESLAMNKPVVSTAMKGLDHTVKDGLNGYTFESEDANSLAMKLQLLINHRLLEVRSTVPERFRLDAMVRSTIEVYNKALP